MRHKFSRLVLTEPGKKKVERESTETKEEAA